MSSVIPKEMSSDEFYGEEHTTPGMQSIAAGSLSVRPINRNSDRTKMPEKASFSITFIDAALAFPYPYAIPMPV